MRPRRSRIKMTAILALSVVGILVLAHQDSDRQRRIRTCVEETLATSDDLCARMEDVGKLPPIAAVAR
jgi:hypothetical protein